MGAPEDESPPASGGAASTEAGAGGEEAAEAEPPSGKPSGEHPPPERLEEPPKARRSGRRRWSPTDRFLGPIAAVDRRFLLVLVVLAVVTRLVWVLWVHPPGAYVFSDMHKYVDRAQKLATQGFVPGVPTLAWQAWGTHYLLAIPLALFGRNNLIAAGVCWGLMSAAAVPLGYLLAVRVSSRPLLAKIAGVVLLLWHPSVSNSGYFLSETPFLFFQLWSTYWLVVTLQEGRRALGAGLVSAVAFAVRPQSALFFLLVLATWLVNRKRLPQVQPRHLAMISAPLLAMLLFSLWRFHAHTGYWMGIAENANMNLTAGRCHNIVTQAFHTEAAKERSERRNDTRDGRRVSLPGFRMVARKIPPNNILALRPAMRSETIRFVGYIGDPHIHRELRRVCYARTGTVEQLRYSLVNVSLLWFIGHQWPEMEKGHERFYPPIDAFRYIYQVGVWLPSLLGMVWAIARIRKRPALTLCAWQLVTSMTVAAIFFGTIRLRTPYDPYAIILALEVWYFAIRWVRMRRERRRTATAPND